MSEEVAVHFKMKLFDMNGREIASKVFTVWKDELLVGQYSASTKGQELYRDAVHSLGLYDQFLAARIEKAGAA